MEEEHKPEDWLHFISGKHMARGMLIALLGVLLDQAGSGRFQMKARILKKLKGYVESDLSFEKQMRKLFDD